MRKLLGVLVWLIAFLPLVAQAQTEMEIIPLRAKTVDQVLPTLLPMVEPGGMLQGANNQLFLRASRKNREDIKRMLAAIDVPARSLIIRVSNSRGVDESSRGVAGSGRVVVSGDVRVQGNARVWDTTSQRNENASQMVRAMEGSPAYINVGRSLPVPMRQVVMGPGGAVVTDTVVYRDIGSGFYATPRVNGQNVILDISQQAETAGAYGSVNSQRMATTVSGQLGQWIEVGGSGRQAMGSERGTLSISSGEVRDNRSIWLMVEEAP